MPDHLLNSQLAATVDATRATERDLFGALDDAERLRPIRPGDWSPKDVQAHLTAWKGRQADRYAAVRGHGSPAVALEAEEEDALNEELRAARATWSWPDVVAEADATAERLGSEVRRADPEALRASDRLIGGTFGNGVLHSLTHFRWLAEAGIPIEADSLDAFATRAAQLVRGAAIPDRDQAIGLYDIACFRVLSGAEGAARDLVREAFQLSPDLVEFAATDVDLISLRSELDSLRS